MLTIIVGYRHRLEKRVRELEKEKVLVVCCCTQCWSMRRGASTHPQSWFVSLRDLSLQQSLLLHSEARHSQLHSELPDKLLKQEQRCVLQACAHHRLAYHSHTRFGMHCSLKTGCVP